MFRALLLFGGLLFFSSVQSQSFIGLGGGGGWTDRAGLRASIPFEYSFNPYMCDLTSTFVGDEWHIG